MDQEVKVKRSYRRKEDFVMKLKRCMIMGITACLIIGSMSGCSSKENGNSQSNQKEQTIQTNQTEEEISENEDVKNEEELQIMRKRFNQSKGVQLF